MFYEGFFIMKTFKIFFWFCLFTFIFIFVNLFSKSAFAINYYFNEEFNDALDDTTWRVYKNAGDFEIINDYIHLYSNKNSFPFIHTKNVVFPSEDDFTFEISFKYRELAGWGNGISLSYDIPSNLQTSTMGGYSVFAIWQGSDGVPLRISSLICSEEDINCTGNNKNIFYSKLNDLDQHTLLIDYKNNKYELFFDGQKIFTSVNTAFRPRYIWFGHYIYFDHNNKWTSFNINHIKIIKNVPPPSPTLLLPGLGGCWSREGILQGMESDDWHLGPGVFIYDNLRDTLTSNDYAEGQNFDVFCYDWRKEIDLPSLPDSEITDKYLVSSFKQKIDEFFTQNNNQKINLVGHSMGGLVIRAYAQRYGMEKINKIVTVGSPHYGTVKAYEVWEGAQIIDPERFTLSDFFMQMLLTANRLKYSTAIETIRNIAPSGENFLPTFVFMKSVRNPNLTLLPQNLKQKNNFLFGLNSQNFDEVKEAMTTIAGIEEDEDYDTLRWLVINDINWFGTKTWLERINGKWEDMKPEDRKFSLDGDLHILKLSSLIEGTNQIEIPGTHDSIMHEQKGLQAILNGLGLGYDPVINPPPFLFKIPFIAAIIHSPADIKITGPGLEAGYNSAGCNNCYYNADEGVIFISNAPEGDYQIELTPKNGGGDYRLDFGQITKDEENWNSIDGKIGSDPVVYPIRFDPQNIQTIPFVSENGQELLEIAKNELFSLNDDFEGIDNYSVKRRIKYYNKKSLRYLNSANKYLSSGNYRRSSTYIIRCLSQIYKTRLLIDRYYQQGKIDYTSRSLIANKLMNTIEILNHAFVIVRQNSSAINFKTAQRYLNSLKKLFQRLESNFSSFDQTNYFLGSIIEPAEKFLNTSEEEFNQENYESSYIHSFGARWLILEAMKINLRGGGF